MGRIKQEVLSYTVYGEREFALMRPYSLIKT